MDSTPAAALQEAEDALAAWNDTDDSPAVQYAANRRLYNAVDTLYASLNNKVDDSTQRALDVNENVAGNVDPEELAMRLNINYSWFRRVFKEYTGYAPAKYFQELKLRKAKQLLVGTSQSVKEILFFLVSSLPNTSFLFLRSVQGLLRWSIVRLGEKSEFIIYQRNI